MSNRRKVLFSDGGHWDEERERGVDWRKDKTGKDKRKRKRDDVKVKPKCEENADKIGV
jgi:hypothetical protein